MIRFLELLIALLIVAALFVVVGLFLPDERYVEHSLETNRPVRQVYDTLNSFRRYKDWHPLRGRDPNIELRLEGPPSGVGARLVYSSRNPQIGSGSLEIVESVQDERIVIEATNKAYGENKLHTFTLDEKNKTVGINWGYQVEYGWNLFGRYAGLYVNRTVGETLKVGVGNLVGLLATMPNFDYKQLEITYTEVEPVNVLVSSQATDRNITAVEAGMDKALTDIRKAIAANKLEEAGPPRLVTTNFGTEKYEFDVAIPVRRPGGDAVVEQPSQAVEDAADAAAEVATAAAEATNGAATALAVVQVPKPLEDLTLPEGVIQAVGYGGRALLANYEGHPAALPLVRDMLRAYAAAHGEVIHARAFEEYLSPMDAAAESAQFKVYWPVVTAPATPSGADAVQMPDVPAPSAEQPVDVPAPDGQPAGQPVDVPAPDELPAEESAEPTP